MLHSTHFKVNVNKDYDEITFSPNRVTKVEKSDRAQ